MRTKGRGSPNTLEGQEGVDGKSKERKRSEGLWLTHLRGNLGSGACI